MDPEQAPQVDNVPKEEEKKEEQEQPKNNNEGEDNSKEQKEEEEKKKEEAPVEEKKSEPIKKEEVKDESKLELNIQEIDSCLEKASQFEKEINGAKIAIQKYKESDSEKYISTIQSTFSYKGILTSKLKKSEFGSYTYDNGNNQYIGKWENDKKSGNGVYFYETKSEKETEAYIGEWSEGKREGSGIYVINTSEENNKNKFTAVIGEFKEDVLTSGIKFSSDDASEHVKMWYGNFIEGSLKDKDGIIIEEGNKIFSGKVENDEIQSGIMVSIKKDSVEPEYVYSLTKNEGAFEFEAGVDEEKKSRLLEIIKEYLPIKPNEDIITPFIELKGKVLEILKSKDFIEIADVETIKKEIDSYIQSINEEKLGKLKALLVKK